MQESPQLYQSGCKAVCMHFLKVRDMDGFGFKDPSSTCAHALHFLFNSSFKPPCLIFTEGEILYTSDQSLYNKSSHTIAWSNSLVTIRTARGTSRTYSDESEWSNKLVPTNHPCGTTRKLKELQFGDQSQVSSRYTGGMWILKALAHLFQPPKDSSGCPWKDNRSQLTSFLKTAAIVW